ncbi:MAG: ribonuclease P protein component [Calditrichaeota bacterium]|nr:MAG: ribonuclease P protein component [Calditrichota bacterium]
MVKKEKQFSLPRSVMIKRSIEIKTVLDQGNKKTGKSVNVFVINSPSRRLAIIVPKRIGNAVKRNRMKRLIREIYRTHPQWFQNKAIVFFVKKFNDSYESLKTEIAHLVASQCEN